MKVRKTVIELRTTATFDIAKVNKAIRSAIPGPVVIVLKSDVEHFLDTRDSI